MTKYETPEKYYYRIHHVRPRFKNDVEDVLIHVATELSKLKPMKKKDFDEKFNKSIRMFPNNLKKTNKTINNWRTEISSLFGMVLYDPATDMCKPSDNAKTLAVKQDLVEFFKYFLYSFQYPGGHIKAHEVKKIIEKEIRFKPAYYILNLLHTAEDSACKRFGITKAEATHCIFNDLRVTRDNCSVEDVIKLIESNRNQKLEYVLDGDVIRYAGDILDYMVHANLLEKKGKKYYLNPSEKEKTLYFIKENKYFTEYDKLYKTSSELSKLQEIGFSWFHYVSEFIGKIRFETDVLSYVKIDKAKYLELESGSHNQLISEFIEKTEKHDEITSKDIGNTGELLILGHECNIQKKRGRIDLIKKVVIYPDHLGLGFDIRSYENDDTQKFIEVKTTISNSSLDFKRFHMTDNEYNSASTHKERYYVYRLMISRANIKLFVIRDPIGKYMKSHIVVKLGDGADMTFKKSAGKYEQLLIWKN